MHTIITFAFLLLFTIFALPQSTSAATWHYPMTRYAQRQTVKGFGQFINDDFYKGKEELFPFNRFYGYHAGVDLEALPNEKNEKIPVYAISSGTISYIGNLSGYGGVILQRLDSENTTVLYGHVKITNLSLKTGDHIALENNPVKLTFLGDEFSQETSKERKHLHLGIYQGTNLYFRGHENNVKDLTSKWHDPSKFLKNKNAKDPIQIPIPKTSSKKSEKTVEKANNFLYTLISFIKSLLKRE